MDEVFKLLLHGESWQALKHQGNDVTMIGWFQKACLLRTVTSSNFIFLNRHRMQKNGLSSLKLRHVSRKEMVICLLGKRWKYILRGNDTYSNVYAFYYMIQNNEQMPRSTVHIRESAGHPHRIPGRSQFRKIWDPWPQTGAIGSWENFPRKEKLWKDLKH